MIHLTINSTAQVDSDARHESHTFQEETNSWK